VILKEIPADLWPRNRLEYAGPGALSNAELIAVLLGTGRPGDSSIRVAEDLLVRAGGLTHLGHLSAVELQQIAGIGPAKAAQIQAALEIGRRWLHEPVRCNPQIRSPADIANLLMVEMGHLEKEELRVVPLDTKNFVKRVVTVYHGNLNTAVVRVGEVFRDAVRDLAASIVAVHNHPSLDVTPSPEDVRVTEQLVEAGKLLDIEVLDHIILGGSRYISLKERGLGFR